MKQVKLEEESICLNDLLMELYAIFSQRAKRRNLAFRLEKGADDVRSCIVSDKTKINKILSNLLENAIKYTPAGFVEFGYTLEPGWIVLYVKDSGIGIRPESRALIFERFSREEKNLSGSSGGLGLGLSISKENAQLLGGEVGLESTKGVGSTFFVRIPYRSAVPEEVAVIEDKVDAGIDILVAEDEEINYLFLEAVLKRNPYRTFSVLHARNGKEAIDYCLENPSIQLVLMDIKMPIMNGHEATRQIKLLRPDVPIIAQTAYSTEQDRMMALENGCDDFITKPIDRNLLFQLLEKHLS